MSDYISRETVRRIVDSPRTKTQMLDMLASCPPEDVRPNIHGHWEDRDGISDFMYCSNCGGKKHYSEKWIGCPYCLADMRETKEEKED